jgi:hypothetical protein
MFGASHDGARRGDQSGDRFADFSHPSGEQNPYASPGSQENYLSLIEPIREVLNQIHRELRKGELSLEDYYDIVIETLQDRGVLALDQSEERNLLQAEQILAKCRRWLPLDKKLGKIEFGLQEDYMRLPRKGLADQTEADVEEYQILKERLIEELQEEFGAFRVPAVRVEEIIEYALTVQMALPDERQELLRRRLQTDLQLSLQVDPPLAKYFGPLVSLPRVPQDFLDSPLRGAGDTTLYLAEDFTRAIESIATGSKS